MAYSAAALARRRCAHVYGPGHEREGWRCRAFARWDHAGALDGSGLCTAHAGRTRGPDTGRGVPCFECRTVPKCRCRAYAFPHRPGGGLCRWPDPPAREMQTRGYRFRALPRASRGYVAPTVRRAPDIPSPAGSASPTVSGAVNPAAASGVVATLLARLAR